MVIVSRRARTVLAIAAVVAFVAGAGVLVVLNRNDEPTPAARRSAPPSTTSTPSTTSAPRPAPKPRGAPVLAVKIDNVADARPQTGIGSADVVYVEPVEGGLTRLVAIYAGRAPRVVGPVRSARRTDIQLLAQFGRPVLAYSGAAPELLPSLRAANLLNAPPARARGAFHRNGRPSPHNMYVRPAKLPRGAKAPAQPPLQVGPAPGGGQPTSRQGVGFRAAQYTFTWSARAHRWLVSLDGRPLISTESGRVAAATVVVQRVKLTGRERIEDARGAVSPVAATVGHGRALVLRDGRRFTGTWTRPGPRAPTRFNTVAGLDLPLARGPVWVLLVPA
ncbi:MAG: DUF3048 domain-containing protein [Actinophytocola sp.]|uniref:DUF3048 domain-containing protein n=1 Tax=Actinophytocola sp. TaxID=1872138 RepID=UPI003D6A3982